MLRSSSTLKETRNVNITDCKCSNSNSSDGGILPLITSSDYWWNNSYNAIIMPPLQYYLNHQNGLNSHLYIRHKNKYLILSQKHRAHLIPQFPIPVWFHSSVGKLHHTNNMDIRVPISWKLCLRITCSSSFDNNCWNCMHNIIIKPFHGTKKANKIHKIQSYMQFLAARFLCTICFWLM